MKPTILLIFLSVVQTLWPQEPADARLALEAVDKLRSEVDLVWLMLAAFLVFFMQAGFAYVESGFTRAKNAVNILMKNISDFLIGSLVFYLFGFSLMFGAHYFPEFGIGKIAFSSLMLEDTSGKPIAWNYGFFIFQMVFAGTSMTIVSGAMAERTKFYSYLVFSLFCSGFIYPLFGSLAWSNLLDPDNVGFLARIGFVDFAGSTVVHSLGGWMGLAGSIVLGPRIGKYTQDGVSAILGHNMSMSVLGMFILWFGWFGFNPGSTAAVKDGSFAVVAVTTNMAAVAGGSGAMLTSWILFRRPDVSMVVNGVLAGLVAITAGCYNVDATGAVLVGLVAGVIIVPSVIFLDYLRIDDPVGAVSVHGVAGAWGTLAVGLFANPLYGEGPAGLFYGGGLSQLGIQAIGVCLAFIWAFPTSLLIFYIMKKTIGLRTSVDEEQEGLDILEHGNQAYAEETY